MIKILKSVQQWCTQHNSNAAYIKRKSAAFYKKNLNHIKRDFVFLRIDKFRRLDT